MALSMNDIMGAGGHAKRPEHPDFWRLSEIILALKADMAENEGNPAEQERLWRARYEAIGDFDSIAYSAIQCAIQLHNLSTPIHIMMMTANPAKQEAYIKTVQAFFDGFVMGAEFERRGGHQEMPS